ncbi:MAG: radical SAM protein, partial [bacterium]|nr:radical SAM protein [bacterium]
MGDRLHNLLKKYDVPGPRYTSYPTVPAWGAMGPEHFKEDLRQLQPNEKLSLYFHIPFCEKLCHYCGCMKVITNKKEKSAEYVDFLLKEMGRVASFIPSKKEERLVNQVHFGGGTPNFLKPEELEQIVSKVKTLFTLTPDYEMAIEMHPRTTTKEFNEALPRLGFNRISLGVQDFDPKVQELINRHQTYEMTEEVLVHLRQLGLKAFNFDLIYGLPGQTMEHWADTLKKVLHLKPNRLAVYSYAHVPWVKPYQRSFKDSDLPSPEMKL